MRKNYIAILAVLAGLLLSATTALAVGVSSSEPPEAYVKVDGKVVQHMNIHEFDWYYEYADGGFSYTADRPPGAPEPPYVFPKVKTAGNVKVHVIVRYPDKPEKFYVRTKDGDFISRALYPIKAENGKVVAWGAYFYRNGHHRYVVRVKWAHVPGSEHSYGAVTYLAHLKT
jgi:hypothetical protein